MAAALGALKGMMGSAVGPTGDPKTAGLGKIQSFIKDGMEVGVMGLLLLCGAIPFRYFPAPVPPLTSFGYAGLNLIVGGSMMWGGIKALIQGGIILAHKYLNVYYPSLWFLRAATYFSPWFIYDIIQTLSPTFEKEGYKNPLNGTTIAAQGGKGKINAISLPLIIGVLSAGFYAYMQYIPKSILGSAKPVLDMIAIGIGGASTLAAGGIGSITVLPQIFSSLKQSGSELSTALDTKDETQKQVDIAATAVPPPPENIKEPPAFPLNAPVATNTNSPPFPEQNVEAPAAPANETNFFSTQQGGGALGSSMPSLRDIANGMLGPSSTGDPSPFKSSILYGGGSGSGKANDADSTASTIFLSILAMTALGGMSLALIRNRIASTGQ
jgi:hypothetical protein